MSSPSSTNQTNNLEYLDAFWNYLLQSRQSKQKATSNDVEEILQNEQLEYEKEREEHLAVFKQTNITMEKYNRLTEASLKPIEENWKNFFDDEKNTAISFLMQKNIYFLQTLDNSLQNGTVIELGIGTGRDLQIFNKLFEQVIGIDSSQTSIDLCQELFSNSIRLNQMELTCSKVEEYKFPEKVSVIFAADTLPFVEPTKLRDLIAKIHTALIPGGVFIGNFFITSNRFVNAIQRALFQASFLPKATFDPKSIVKTLLEAQPFSSIKVESDQRNVYFQAKKSEESLSNNENE